MYKSIFFILIILLSLGLVSAFDGNNGPISADITLGNDLTAIDGNSQDYNVKVFSIDQVGDSVNGDLLGQFGIYFYTNIIIPIVSDNSACGVLPLFLVLFVAAILVIIVAFVFLRLELEGFFPYLVLLTVGLILFIIVLGVIGLFVGAVCY